MNQSFDSIDSEPVFSLETLMKAIDPQSSEENWVLALLAEDIIHPIGTTDNQYLFNSVSLTTVRRAARLRRDFDASPQAIGLILSLLDELHGLRQLRRQVALYHEVIE